MPNFKLIFVFFIYFITAYPLQKHKMETSVAPSSLAKHTPKILTSQQWLDDFEELYTYLKSKHRDLYHRTKPTDFENLYLQIKNDIPQLSDHEIIIEFARFVALASDGHTRLSLPLQEGIGLSQAHSKTPLPSDSALVFRHLPLEFYWFDDGLYISSATETYRQHIGKKVLKINKTPIMDALDKVRPISHYDNESGYKLIAPSRLSVLEILKALKISEDKEEIQLTLEHKNRIEEITVIPLEPFSNPTFLYQKTDTEIVKKIVSKLKNDAYYWFEYLEDNKTVYLQLNQMNNAPVGPGLIEFTAELNKFIKENQVERLILDLRNNFGGDNTYSLPIANLILKNPQLNKIGNFYTLIGRKTFSAAQCLVNDLGKWTNVIYVGEPTGASPNQYGDSKKYQLSNSKLTVRISSIYWRDWSSNEDRKALLPDIPIENTASDFFGNKDAALNACLTFQASEELVDTYESLYKFGGMDTAVRLYLRIALDWERPSTDVSNVEKKLVEWMSKNKKD